MDRTQTFIKECLFTKNFNNPNKPIDDMRLKDTLLLSPTDGGVSTRLKKNKSKLNITVSNIEASVTKSSNHPNYRRINKNSKQALKNYINEVKKSTSRAKQIAREKKIKEKSTLLEYLRSNELTLLESLPQYTKFLPMYEELWVGYMKELLGIPNVIKDTKKLTINGSTALIKLSMADYNGSILRVTNSVNKNMIGLQGIVIWDSQKNFIMVTKGDLIDEIKCIPKKGTTFNFEIPLNNEEALQYTILGDRFKYRSSDRAGRKFKSRRCDDMLHYIL